MTWSLWHSGTEFNCCYVTHFSLQFLTALHYKSHNSLPQILMSHFMVLLEMFFHFCRKFFCHSLTYVLRIMNHFYQQKHFVTHKATNGLSHWRSFPKQQRTNIELGSVGLWIWWPFTKQSWFEFIFIALKMCSTGHFQD